MRQQMGSTFETLQQAILSAGFVGAYQGEPDLFCWRAGGWFFAEAKTPGESFLLSQNKWLSIATSLPGVDTKVFGCRVVAQGSLPAGQQPHTPEWNQLMDAMKLTNNDVLDTAAEFVKRVLGNRGAA